MHSYIQLKKLDKDSTVGTKYPMLTYKNNLFLVFFFKHILSISLPKLNRNIQRRKCKTSFGKF